MKPLNDNSMKHLHRQSGISLVEILVSLVISLFLLGGIVQVTGDIVSLRQEVCRPAAADRSRADAGYALDCFRCLG